MRAWRVSEWIIEHTWPINNISECDVIGKLYIDFIHSICFWLSMYSTRIKTNNIEWFHYKFVCSFDW